MRHTKITYSCDWCRRSTEDGDFVRNHVKTNWRHQRVSDWELCDDCFAKVSTAVDQIRAAQ